MSIIRFCLAIVVAGCIVTSGVRAQPGAAPGPEHEVLKKMVGKWETTMKMAGTESKGTCTYSMDLGGLWLASTFEGAIGDQKFVGRGFDSYDSNKKKYVGVWLDSMSVSPMIMEGTYDKEKKTMTLSGEGPGMDGTVTKHKAVSEMPDDNTINFAMYMGNAKEPAFTIVYKRKK